MKEFEADLIEMDNANTLTDVIDQLEGLENSIKSSSDCAEDFSSTVIGHCKTMLETLKQYLLMDYSMLEVEYPNEFVE